jgi:purine-binding chemotaxis protein CheW
MNNTSPTTAAEILRARARALARPPAPPRTAAMIEVLQFRLAQEQYAVETEWVREVVPLRELAPLPGTPAFVRGIVNARGRILPVFDLKKFFDLPEQGLTDLHQIVLVQGGDIELGLLVDLVIGVTTLETDRLQPALPTLTGIRADYLKGVAAGPLVVLDLARVCADPRIIINDGTDK